MPRKIILFELNEVPHRILDEYSNWYPNSELARHLKVCRRFTTYTEDVGHLSPWLTWPTLHRGVTNEQHGIADFGQDTRDVDKKYPPIWKLLAHANVATGVGGSLHTYPLPSDLRGYSFYLPDTFAAGSECHPKLLETFQHFNLAMARESGRNVKDSIDWKSALKLLAKAPQLGFKVRTLLDIGEQLASERIRPARRVRRRTYQSLLAFDVFMQQLEATRPDFVTFFTNHVASSMHRYWAAAFPTDYAEMPYSQEWIATYKDEIRFAMRKTENLLLRLFRFADRNPAYEIWITSSMGQAATAARVIETQLYISDPAKFMGQLGCGREDWKPRTAMLPQFNVAVTEHARAAFLQHLEGLSIGTQPVTFRTAENGFVSIDLGHENLPTSTNAMLHGRPCRLAELGLANVEIQDKSGASAYHVPEGCLVIYDPLDVRPKQPATDRVSTISIAPTILQNYAIPTPSYMRPADLDLLAPSASARD